MSEMSSVTEQETIEFVDSNSGIVAGITSNDDGVAAVDATRKAGLAGFLSRPVRIYSTVWNESDPVGLLGSVLNPWQLYFNNAAIKNKLNNFSWIRADLKLKIVVNASPFYYGNMLVSYRPLVALNSETAPITGTHSEFVPKSQRPHIWIYPQDNMAGDLMLPFFYHKNWLNLQSNQDLLDMGELSLDIVYALASANGATGTGVTVQIYAWADSVEVSGPSVGLALQSRDEYGTGAVSAPASALAKFAGGLSNVPIIGKFARATELGAKAVSGIASLFGFTNVPVIADTQSFRSEPFADLSSSEIGYPVHKLTLDPKNELSVDPSIIGLPSDDELDISTLVKKESLLVTTFWNTADAVDSQLFTTSVTPWIFRRDNTATQRQINMPPCSWVANCFQQWRGDMIFRFKFIKSKYHRGRVMVSWDPSGQGANNIVQTTNTFSTVYTKILDLGESDMVEIRIPYAQALPWLDTNTSFTNDVWFRRAADTAPNYTYNPLWHNGTLTMRVLNTLTAPVTTSEIGVIISVMGGDNLEFANPTHLGEFSPFAVQSQDVFQPEDGEIMTFGNEHTSSENRYLLNFGEQISSLRQLLRRSQLSEVSIPDSDTTSYIYVLQHDSSKFPIPYGYDPNGLNNATGLVSGTSKPFNFTFSTLINWLTPAFVGVRGSTIVHYNCFTNSPTTSPLPHIRVVRRPNSSVQQCTRASTVLAAKTTTSATMSFLRNTLLSGAAGQALTNGQTQAGLSVLHPNYNKFRFQSTSPGKISAPSPLDGSDFDTHRLEIVMDPTFGPTTRALTVEKYISVGTDFSLNWFLNVPTFYFYIGTIVPV